MINASTNYCRDNYPIPIQKTKNEKDNFHISFNRDNSYSTGDILR